MINEKHSIENFYVGQLHLRRGERCNLFAGYESLVGVKSDWLELEKMEEDIIMNGAIRIEDYCDDNGDCYEMFLSLFYKKNDNYFCLHNGVFYSLSSSSCCENLVSLLSVLPKIDFNIANSISFGEAISLFDALFKRGMNNEILNRYNRTLFSLDDFSVGPLNLYCGYGSVDGKYNYYDLPKERLLSKNNANLLMFSEIIETKDGNDIIHDYVSFNCLFVKLPGDNLYNINDYQIYTDEMLRLFDDRFGYNYYDRMITFSDFMKDKGVDYDKKEITIPKALKIYKRLK